MVDDALFDDGDEVEYRAQGEGGQGDAKQVLAAANQGEDGMQEAERVERGGHAKPDDAHFSHGRIGELESEITVYRGGAAATGGAGFTWVDSGQTGERGEKPHALTPGRPLEVVRLPRGNRACGGP